MKKGIKIVLIVSLLLNVGLIIGFVSYTSYMKEHTFRFAALSAEAEAKVLKNILSDLDSDDPAKITALKERLRKDIEKAKKASINMQQAAKW